MNLFKAYALCINVGKIKLANDKVIDKYKCDIFKTLEEAETEMVKKTHMIFKLLKFIEINL